MKIWTALLWALSLVVTAFSVSLFGVSATLALALAVFIVVILAELSAEGRK